jgi:hypothetical protein
MRFGGSEDARLGSEAATGRQIYLVQYGDVLPAPTSRHKRFMPLAATVKLCPVPALLGREKCRMGYCIEYSIPRHALLHRQVAKWSYLPSSYLIVPFATGPEWRSVSPVACPNETKQGLDLNR